MEKIEPSKDDLKENKKSSLMANKEQEPDLTDGKMKIKKDGGGILYIQDHDTKDGYKAYDYYFD